MAGGGQHMQGNEMMMMPPAMPPLGGHPGGGMGLGGPPPLPHIQAGGSHPDEVHIHQSIRILEDCKWCIILEHGAMGEVVAVAAFAPGPGGESTPNTPATPSGIAGAMGMGMQPSGDFAFDVQQSLNQARARSSNSGGNNKCHLSTQNGMKPKLIVQNEYSHA